MKEIYNLLKKHNIKPFSYKKNGNVFIVDSSEGKYVIKKIKNKDIFPYLDSRSFNYYPKYVLDNDYLIMEYLEEESISNDQKMADLIHLVSLLHSKTSFYSVVDIDSYKKDYENIKNKIEYLLDHYEKLITYVESVVFMSPSELLLARNISIILGALNYSNHLLEVWYKSVSDKTRRRYSIIHNNLELDHFIKNKSSYLISWDSVKSDLPIYDIYKLYRKYAFSFDFKSLFKKYEKNYPILDDEKILFNVLICIPDEFNFTNDIYNDCVRIEQIVDYLYKTESIVLPNELKDTEENKKAD